MSEDNFNMSLRRFLKRVGVSSQQKIEEAVRAGGGGGAAGKRKVTAKVVLTVDGLDIRHEVEGEIDLPGNG